MYGMSVQQAIFNYSSSVIQGMQKYTKINSSNSSFLETLSKIDSAKNSRKKRIQPEESTVERSAFILFMTFISPFVTINSS